MTRSKLSEQERIDEAQLALDFGQALAAFQTYVRRALAQTRVMDAEMEDLLAALSDFPSMKCWEEALGADDE